MKTYNISKVLMPTDFSELTNGAFKSAVAICKRQNASLTLLHVIEELTYVAMGETMVPTINITPDLIMSYTNNIEGLAIKLTLETGIKVEGKINVGNAAERICATAYDEKFDLIVMGTHGASGLREFFIGSNAFRVVKNATCPVLTIPGNWERTDFKKVIFPVRLRPGATEKYDYARPIIEKNISDLLIVGLAEQENPQSMVDLSNLVDLFKMQLYNDKVEFSSILYHSAKFPEKVIEAANGYDADLIVITANLDYDFKAYFVGPFAQQIVNHSKRPVLSIRAAVIDEAYSATLNDTMQNMQEKYLKLGIV